MRDHCATDGSQLRRLLINMDWKEDMTKRIDPFAKPLRPSEIGIRGEICSKWSKLSAQEILDLKSIDDLVNQVQSKYQLGRLQAQSEVDAFAKGRQL